MPSQPALIHRCMFKAIVESWNLLKISFMRVSVKIPLKIEWNVTSPSISSSNAHEHFDWTGHFEKTIVHAYGASHRIKYHFFIRKE